MSGIALTEPSTGQRSQGDHAHRPTAQGDRYVVNGTKTMITQARHADPLVVLAVTDPTATPPHRGMSLLLVEQDTPGCTVGRDIGKLGHKGVELCEVRLRRRRVVPVGNLLGGVEGAGLYQMLSALDRGRIYMAAASVGIARAALEAATRYATEREAFGKPIGEHQAIKLKLARHGHPGPGGAPAHARRRARRIDRERSRRQRGGDGQGVRVRDRDRLLDGGDADPRRLRVHGRLPGRALLPRRSADGDRRGHERDPATADRRRTLLGDAEASGDDDR